MLNGTWSEPWEYIRFANLEHSFNIALTNFTTLDAIVNHLSCCRKISPTSTGSDSPATDYNYIIPVVDPASLDLRCGRNASTAWSNPKLAVIHAGDEVGFAVNTSVGLPIAGATIMPWDVCAPSYTICRASPY